MIMTKKLLIFDDDKDVLDSLFDLLTSYGYAVDQSPRFSSELLDESNPPDLIILDLLLAGQNGRIICQDLKSHPETQDIPILMISAYPEAETTTKEAGANSFLAKPFGIDNLVDEIEKLTMDSKPKRK